MQTRCFFWAASLLIAGKLLSFIGKGVRKLNEEVSSAVWISAMEHIIKHTVTLFPSIPRWVCYQSSFELGDMPFQNGGEWHKLLMANLQYPLSSQWIWRHISFEIRSLVLGLVSNTWLYDCYAYLFFSCFSVQKYR